MTLINQLIAQPKVLSQSHSDKAQAQAQAQQIIINSRTNSSIFYCPTI